MNELKWIPVSERLPSCGHIVDVANNILQITRRGFISNGRWLQEDSEPIHRIELEVTHWKECDPPPPNPDAFDVWWNLCGMVDGQKNYRYVGYAENAPICAPVAEVTAKAIWMAAIQSTKGKQ